MCANKLRDIVSDWQRISTNRQIAQLQHEAVYCSNEHHEYKVSWCSLKSSDACSDEADDYILHCSSVTLAAMSGAESGISLARPANAKRDLKISQQAEASSNKEISPDKVENGKVESQAGNLAPAASAEASTGVLLCIVDLQASACFPRCQRVCVKFTVKSLAFFK